MESIIIQTHNGILLNFLFVATCLNIIFFESSQGGVNIHVYKSCYYKSGGCHFPQQLTAEYSKMKPIPPLTMRFSNHCRSSVATQPDFDADGSLYSNVVSHKILCDFQTIEASHCILWMPQNQINKWMHHKYVGIIHNFKLLFHTTIAWWPIYLNINFKKRQTKKTSPSRRGPGYMQHLTLHNASS